eukprot:TRINITY_DN4979_c0_g1_i1.p1 TRINITY_DN4979_c0_g1~~TRINITY_DN4979_c0_g1_i1.p1  ORF type:complete len:232 (+),score=46.93 TRINITY_DN4979_c0_g1_i1:3-698(+)
MVVVVRCLSANVHKQDETAAGQLEGDDGEEATPTPVSPNSSSTSQSPSSPAVEFCLKDAVGLLASRGGGGGAASSPTIGGVASGGVDPCFSLRDLCAAAVDNGESDHQANTSSRSVMSDAQEAAGLAVFRAMHNEVLDVGCKHLKSKFALVPVQDGAKSLVRTFARYASSRLQHSPYPAPPINDITNCLLYTSDAADEEDSVDLGGRRIIKKKTKLVDADVTNIRTYSCKT